MTEPDPFREFREACAELGGTIIDALANLPPYRWLFKWWPTTDTGEPDYRMSDEPGDLNRKFLDDAL